MPTWGWFVVALVLIDTAVLAAWLLARKSPREKTAAATRFKLAGLDASARDEIQQLISEKMQIRAVEVLQDRTGFGAKEARGIVESVAQGNPFPTPSSYIGDNGLDSGAWEDIIPKLRALKAEGRTLAAIKLVRSRTGLSLRDAKEAVDRI